MRGQRATLFLCRDATSSTRQNSRYPLGCCGGLHRRSHPPVPRAPLRSGPWTRSALSLAPYSTSFWVRVFLYHSITIIATVVTRVGPLRSCYHFCLWFYQRNTSTVWYNDNIWKIKVFLWNITIVLRLRLLNFY